MKNNRILPILLLTCTCLFTCIGAMAQATATWNGSVSEEWNNAANWTWNGGSGIPNSATEVIVVDAVPFPLKLSAGTTASCGNLTLESSTAALIVWMEDNATLNVYGNVANGSGVYPAAIIASVPGFSTFHHQTAINFRGTTSQELSGITIACGKVRINKLAGDVSLGSATMLYTADSLIFENMPVSLGAASTGNILVNDGNVILNSESPGLALPAYSDTQIPPHIITNQAPDYNNQQGLVAAANPFTFSGLTTTAFFPIGSDNKSFTPVTITQTATSNNAWGVFVSPQLLPACGNNPLDTANFVRRNWQLTALHKEELYAVTGSPADLSFTFNKNNTNEEVDTGFNPGNKSIKIMRYGNNCYGYLTGNLPSGSSGYITVTKNAQNQFGTFALAPDTNQAVVGKITVTIEGEGSDTIITDNGTRQMIASSLPDSTRNQVFWSIVPGTGSATISSTGLLTAVSDGTVYAKAVSEVTAGIKDSLLITISNQVTSIKNTAPAYGCVVYPNPFTNSITLHIEKSHPEVDLRVVDMFGRIMYAQTIKANSLNMPKSIDLRQLKAGTYVLLVHAADLRWHSKIVKN